jgi:hypothetical protein
MATILFSSDTVPLSSVIICCTIVATLNMSSKDELFTEGAWTDWPVYWLFCCERRWSPDLSAGCNCCCWGCCVLPRSTAAKDCPWVTRLPENLFPVDSFGRPSGFSFAGSPLWRGCSLGRLTDAVFPLPWDCSYSIWAPSSRCSLTRGNPCAGGRLHTTYNGVVVCSWPRCARTADSCSIVLGCSGPCKLPP